MLKEKVLICTVVKNVEATIRKNIQLAIKTGQYFSQYHIIIYENNSQDNTKAILKHIDHPNVSITSEDISQNEFLHIQKQYNDTHNGALTRIEQICFARNKVLQAINTPTYDHFTHVIWIDMDAKNWSIKGVLDSFEKQDIWDVVYGASYQKYYDYFALRIQHNSLLNLGTEIMGEKWWHELNKIQLQFNVKKPFQPQIKITTPITKQKNTYQLIQKKLVSFIPLENTEKTQGLLPVLSAFNGIGIFKKDIFKQFSYHYLITEDVKHIYRNYIHKQIYQTYQSNIENHDRYFLKSEKDTESNIVWKYRESDKPVLCEHVALNFSLIKHHYKIYINPKMTYTRYISLKTKVHNIVKLFSVIFKKTTICIKIILSIFKRNKNYSNKY